MTKKELEKLPRGGDCYIASLNYIQKMAIEGRDMDKFHLIHAEVMGQRELKGVQYGHAWVEEDVLFPIRYQGQTKLMEMRYVHDLSGGRTTTIPAEVYRNIGRVDEIGNFHEYSYEVALSLAMKFETYGPWDLKTSTNL